MLLAELRRLKAIHIIERRGNCTTRMLASRCHVSRHTALKDLRGLVAAGKLSRHGRGSATYYTLADQKRTDG